ncbi:alpha-1D adrenergic receptor-like [Patiria miniata]|uniref:G-protein coupled receptors family 1 profile domain-containing protein n=1 Tax=Patiria miniata TaxID=46514 RepID=A0A913YYM9_PATMI|nr:alpha-1D adrenergic receptor-like [Patiria miniata]
MDGVIENSTETPSYEFTDYTQRVIVATLILMISVVGLVGNTMIHLAVLLSKKLRTATNTFVVNLSVADWLTCLAIPWNSVALLSTDGLPVSEWFCKVVATVQFTTVGCSIITLGFIALNRLLLITRPTTTYHLLYTPRKIVLWVALSWLIPLLTSLLPPLTGVGAVGYNPQFYFCGSKPSNPHYNIYNIIIAAVLYPIPLVTIVVSYSLIWLHLRRHAKKMIGAPKKKPKYAPTNIAMVPSHHSEENSEYASRSGTTVNNSPSRKRRRQNEVTKNMVYVVCGFGLCATPYAINLFFFDMGPTIPYTTVILLLNNCINPLIYATKHRDFKTVFGCILRRQWDKIPNPSDFLKKVRRTKCCGA